MSLTTVRDRMASFAIKLEVTPGTDSIAGTPAASDWVMGDFEFQYDQAEIPNPEVTGSLDYAPPIPGSVKATVTLRIPLRGAGATGSTAPDWGKLMEVCAFAPTTTGAAVGAPTAAASGTTTTVTAATPFAAVVDSYLGMPLAVSGDQAFTSAVIGYTAGRLISLPETRSAALTTSSLLQIPANIRWAPTSDETVYKNATGYFYKDGVRWIAVGLSGTWSLEMKAGEPAYLTFNLVGQFVSVTTTAMPTGWNTIIRPTAPRWVLGRSQVDRTLSRLQRLTIRAGVELTMPDNPEAQEGYDPGLPIGRRSGGDLDPLMDTTAGTALLDKLRTGVNFPVFAQIGSAVGNRFIVTFPSARGMNPRHGNRESLTTQEFGFLADGADRGLFLASY